MTTATYQRVICALCWKWVEEFDPAADRYVFAFDGSVKYISIAHRTCASVAALFDREAGWEWD
jgi:hypothetical protein